MYTKMNEFYRRRKDLILSATERKALSIVELRGHAQDCQDRINELDEAILVKKVVNQYMALDEIIALQNERSKTFDLIDKLRRKETNRQSLAPHCGGFNIDHGTIRGTRV